jgi:hypothetical protein
MLDSSFISFDPIQFPASERGICVVKETTPLCVHQDACWLKLLALNMETFQFQFHVLSTSTVAAQRPLK